MAIYCLLSIFAIIFTYRLKSNIDIFNIVFPPPMSISTRQETKRYRKVVPQSNPFMRCANVRKS